MTTGAGMATLNFGVNDNLAVKLWSMELERDALQKLWLMELVGDGADAIIQRKTEFEKGQGDRIRFALRYLLSGRGKTEGQTLYGDEEILRFGDFDLTINELRHATEVPSGVNISLQRFIKPELREEGKDALSDWFAERFEVAGFNHLCGNTVVVDDAYRANNTILAPSANRLLRAGGVANDQSLGTSNVMELSILDAAIEATQVAVPKIRPGRIRGGAKGYVCIVHPFQATDIARDTGTDGWLNIQLSKIQGGNTNALDRYTPEYIGTYKNVDIYSSRYIATGVHGSTGAEITTVRRALFLGAQAAVMGFGKGVGRSKFSWSEESKDYGHSLGIAGSTIWGFRKTRYTNESGGAGQDYGMLTISTYAAAHTS